MMWGATPPPPPSLILLILSSNCALLPGHYEEAQERWWQSAVGSRAVALLAVAVERASDFYFLLSFVLSRPLMVTKLRFCQVLLSRGEGGGTLILMDLSVAVGRSVGLDHGFDRDGLTGWIGVG